MALATSYHTEANQDTDYPIDWVTIFGIGQSFFNQNQCVLDSVKFDLKKTGAPIGNLTAKIFAHSGTYGTSSVPTGSALATSDNFDVSTTGAAFALKTFTFSGANRITLAANTYYVLLVDGLNTFTAIKCPIASGDSSAPSHGGNIVTTADGTIWAADATGDLSFYVLTDAIVANRPFRSTAIGGASPNAVYTRKRAPVNLKNAVWNKPERSQRFK